MYNAAYGNAPTYPIFWARHVNQLLTSPLMLVDLFLVSGVSYNTSEPLFALSCSHPSLHARRERAKRMSQVALT